MEPAKLLDENVSGDGSDESDFSFVLGGPLYQLYLRTRLARPSLELVFRRVTAMSLICWLPLLILALIERHGFGGVSIPFLRDVGVHVRFLVVLPLLVGAELFVHERLTPIVRQFLQRGIITQEVRGRFEALLASTMRLRNSALVELGLALFIIVAGSWGWRQGLTFGVSSWYAVGVAGNIHLTSAGYWYQFVSSSILKFILLRWYFRLGLWYLFLWRVRGLPLQLNLLHPDRAAGLGFLAGSVYAFVPVLAAQTVFVAGLVADRIWHAGATLPDFKVEIASVVALLLLLAFTPLCFFMVQLEEAGRKAKREYGILASHYVEDFRRKWIQERGIAGEPLLGTSDIQSLADLGNVFNVVTEMRLVPFTKKEVLYLAIIIVLPLLPLTLTMVPLEKIIDHLIHLPISATTG